MRGKLVWALLAFFAIAALARGQAPVFGPEFQVNTTTTSYQYAPSVANIGPASNFVVVWSSDGQDGSQTGAVGRLFNAAGTPLGGEFAINVSTTGYQDRVLVGSNAAGNFVVAWTEFVSYDASYEIRARRFDSSGTPQGGDIVVNTWTTGTQVYSPVAMDSAGNFVVVWNSAPDFLTGQTPQDGSGSGIFARRFDANGNPLSAEFQVNQYTTGSQYSPRIAMNPAGDFIIVWTSEHQDAQASSIMARRYDNVGAPLGGEFRVNTQEANFQQEPDVALDPAGRAIVVWQSNEQDGSEMGVYGQRFDASGNKLGPEFNVNAFTPSDQWRPRVVAGFGSSDPGEFAVIWHSEAEDGSDAGVYAQHFDETGRRSSLELRVNEFTAGFQGYPAIAAQPNGQFVAAWQSEGNDGSDLGIAARLAGVPRAELNLVDVPHVPGATGPSGASNQNGVLEVGEEVNYETSFRNWTPDPMTLTGTASNWRGPLSLSYDITDTTSAYGTIPGPAGIADCFQATGDCYLFSLGGTRPAVQHVDTAFDETLSYNGFIRTAALHVGGSFADVPSNNLFYPFIENLFHNGVTGGCAGGGYCPLNNVTRAQMAVFLLKARWGAVFLPPPATGTLFPDVPASNPFARWIEELSREQVTGGCGGGLYCPDNPVTRQQMAVFLIKTFEGPAYVPQVCGGDFDDVPCPSQFADWIEDLYGRGITGGCGPDLYCPLNSVLRQQMAAFLVKTFGLALY
jgi:S-layer homology domain